MIEGYNRDRTIVLSSRSTMQDHKDTNGLRRDHSKAKDTHRDTGIDAESHVLDEGREGALTHTIQLLTQEIDLLGLGLGDVDEVFAPHDTLHLLSRRRVHLPSNRTSQTILIPYYIYHTIVIHNIKPYHRSYQALPLSYHTIYHVIPCIIYHIKPYYVIYHIASYHKSYHTMSYHIIPYVESYHTPYHTISYQRHATHDHTHVHMEQINT